MVGTTGRTIMATATAMLVASLWLVTTPAPSAATPSAEAVVQAAPAPTPARTGSPTSIAVLGDSISSATGTGQLSAEMPQNSWVTGSVPWSMRGQLAIPNGSAYNQASNGKRMGDMDDQAASLPTSTQYVVVELGGNDLCRPSVGEMTSTTDYRNQFRAGLAALKARVPNASIFVASIPDIYNLWFIRGAPSSVNPYVSDQKHQEGRARFFWDNFLDIEVPCQSLLSDPQSLAPADANRRLAVRARNEAFNAVLRDECGAVLRCRYDDDFFFDFSSNRANPPDGPLLPRNQWGFEDQDISHNRHTGAIDLSGTCPVAFAYAGCGDHFHPSLIGQQKLANAGHATSYQWSTDATAPTVALTAARPPDGAGKYGSSVSVSIAGSDASGVRGFEVRVHHPNGTVGAWQEHVGAAPPVTVSATGQTYVEARALDNNANLSASSVLAVNLDPDAFGGLSGTVVDQDGGPLAGITVTRHAAATQGVQQGVTTGSDGGYDFGTVLAASYKLRFTDPTGAHVDEWHLDQLTHADADGVTVGAQADVVVDADLARPATINVLQDTAPDGPQDFTFTTDPASTPFTLDDDTDPVLPNTTGPLEPGEGTHTITQGAVAGWTLIGIDCDAGALVDLGTRSVTLTVVDGDAVDCTFVNAHRQPDAQVATANTGPFKGAGVTATTVTPAQTKSTGVARGSTRTFFVRAVNAGGAIDALRVKGVESGSAGYTVRYLRGRTDITTAVRAGGYVITDVAPGTSVTVKVKITASTAAAAGSARNADLIIRSAAIPSQRDVVRARALRN